MNRTTAFTKILPAPSLRRYIGYYWTIYLPRPLNNSRFELSLPDLYAEIIFNFSQPYLRKSISNNSTQVIKASNIVGLRSQTVGSRREEAKAALYLIGVKLYPWVLSAITGIAASTISNTVVDLKEGPAWLQELEARLYSTFDPALQINLLNQYFLKQIRQNPIDDTWIRHSLGLLVQNSNQTVKELAQNSYSSIKTLERKFKTQLGCTPKKLLRVQRFQSWLQKAKQLHEYKEAYPLGAFYDQSHLIKECHYFLDSTPLDFSKRSSPYTINTFVGK